MNAEALQVVSSCAPIRLVRMSVAAHLGFSCLKTAIPAMVGHTHMHTHICTPNTHAHANAHTHMHAHTDTRTYIHAHTCTHAYTHIHTNTPALFNPSNDVCLWLTGVSSCSPQNNCTQLCTRVNTTETCYCRPGYVLSRDNRTCTGRGCGLMALTYQGTSFQI